VRLRLQFTYTSKKIINNNNLFYLHSLQAKYSHKSLLITVISDMRQGVAGELVQSHFAKSKSPNFIVRSHKIAQNASGSQKNYAY